MAEHAWYNTGFESTQCIKCARDKRDAPKKCRGRLGTLSIRFDADLSNLDDLALDQAMQKCRIDRLQANYLADRITDERLRRAIEQNKDNPAFNEDGGTLQ